VFVPLAEATANAQVGPEPTDGTREGRRAWSERWDAAYHRAMARLTSDPFVIARRAAA
jgi:hypothetical protein